MCCVQNWTADKRSLFLRFCDLVSPGGVKWQNGLAFDYDCNVSNELPI